MRNKKYKMHTWIMSSRIRRYPDVSSSYTKLTYELNSSLMHYPSLACLHTSFKLKELFIFTIALRRCNSQAGRGFTPVAQTMFSKGDIRQRTCSAQRKCPGRERNQWSLLPSQVVSHEPGFVLPV